MKPHADVNAGDRVLLCSIEEAKKRNGTGIAREMKQNFGQIVTIEAIIKNEIKGDLFYIKEDNWSWYYSPDWIESIIEDDKIEPTVSIFSVLGNKGV